MDLDDFRKWMIARRGCSPSYADLTLRRIREILKTCFDADQFFQDPAGADDCWDDVITYATEHCRPGAPRAYGKVLKLLRWYVERGRPEYKLLGQWDLPPEPRSEGPTLTPAEVRVVHSLYKGKRDWRSKRRRAMLYAAEHLGIRRGELARMRLRDLDVLNCQVHIHSPTKRGERRRVHLPSDAFAPTRPLVAWMEARPEPVDGSDMLWVGRHSKGHPIKPLTPEGISREFNYFSRDAGFRISPTRFRRWDVQMLQGHGVPVESICHRKGHSGIQVTQRYMRKQHSSLVIQDLQRCKVPGYGRASKDRTSTKPKQRT